MILFYLNQANQKQGRFIRDLFRSYNGKKHIQATSRFLDSGTLNAKADIIVFAGMLRGDGLIYRYCVDNKKDFLYIDHAYLERGYNPTTPHSEWMRITPNSFAWTLNQKENDDRWQEFFARKYQFSPWNSNNGKNILVLPPSDATKALFPNAAEWTKNTIEEISKVTSAPIIIREKPNQPIVDVNTNQVLRREIHQHNTTIETEMLNAKCIVTFNSAVPVLGVVMGIPCYCSPHAAAYPMNINLNLIDNPPEPNRQNWLNQLVYHQYRTSEMRDGSFWKIINNYLPKVGNH